MKSNFDKKVNHYIKQVRKSLLCKNSKKKIILNDLKDQIYDYATSNSITGFNLIVENFGMPEDIAREVVFGENRSEFNRLKKNN